MDIIRRDSALVTRGSLRVKHAHFFFRTHVGINNSIHTGIHSMPKKLTKERVKYEQYNLMALKACTYDNHN